MVHNPSDLPDAQKREKIEEPYVKYGLLRSHWAPFASHTAHNYFCAQHHSLLPLALIALPPLPSAPMQSYTYTTASGDAANRHDSLPMPVAELVCGA